MEGGSLADRLHKSKVPLSESQRLTIATQITEGLRFLHGSGASAIERVIVHSDLKPENVMVSSFAVFGHGLWCFNCCALLWCVVLCS
jgi:serine/threonine protein kinase